MDLKKPRAFQSSWGGTHLRRMSFFCSWKNLQTADECGAMYSPPLYSPPHHPSPPTTPKYPSLMLTDGFSALFPPLLSLPSYLFGHGKAPLPPYFLWFLKHCSCKTHSYDLLTLHVFSSLASESVAKQFPLLSCLHNSTAILQKIYEQLNKKSIHLFLLSLMLSCVTHDAFRLPCRHWYSRFFTPFFISTEWVLNALHLRHL